MANYPLRSLEASFLKWSLEKADENHGRKLPDGTMQWGGFDVDIFTFIDKLEDADGLYLLCPKCFEENGGVEGTHGLHIYFEGKNTPLHLGKNSKGETVRWKVVGGESLDDLQLTPSILLEVGCNWHGFVGTSGILPGHAG